MNIDPKITIDLMVYLAFGIFTTALSTIGGFIWLKFSVKRLESVAFSENGEVRLVSFSAHERISEDCRRSLTNEGIHLKEALTKLEQYQERREDMFISEMRNLSEEIKTLSECVAKLSAGAKC